MRPPRQHPFQRHPFRLRSPIPRTVVTGAPLCLALVLLTSCVGSSGKSADPAAVPTPGDARNQAELAEVLPEALDAAESASWRLFTFDSSGLTTVNSGRLSCDGDGSGAYAIKGGGTQSTPAGDFIPGRDFEDDEIAPAKIQAAGSVATSEGLHANSGGDFWPVDAAEVPTDYTEDLAAARGANCSHITATIATSSDLRLVDAMKVDGAPVSHWQGTAYINDLHENAVGFAEKEYAMLTTMNLGEAAVDVELWVDGDNRPVAYFQHLPPDRTGLQDRWFALSLGEWNDVTPVLPPDE